MRPRYVMKHSIWPVLKFRLILPSLLSVAVVNFVWALIKFLSGNGDMIRLIASGVLSLVGLIFLSIQLWKIIYQKFRSVEFYEHRVVKKWGVFDKDSESFVFAAVYKVSLKQRWWERILGYGDLKVDCAGEWDLNQHNITHPKKAQRFLQSRISSEGMTNIIHN